MTKWEYKIEEDLPISHDGKLLNELNKLGEDEWELVTRLGNWLVFKREKRK